MTSLPQSLRYFVGHGAPHAVAAYIVGTFRLQRANLLHVMHRHVLHAGQIRLLSIQPSRLQTVERVVWPKMVRQLAIEQHVAPCAMDKEQAGLRAVRLNCDQRGPPLRNTWPFVNLRR